MADDVTVDNGAGSTDAIPFDVATEDVGSGKHAQIVKLAIATDGSRTLIPSDANGLLIQTTSAGLAVQLGSGNANGLPVQGITAHDAAITANPVLIGARSSFNAPTSVDNDNDITRIWCQRNGAVMVAPTAGAGGALVGGDASGLYQQGPAAHDAAVAGQPILIGGRASSAIPTWVDADGDATRAWYTRAGAQVISTLDDEIGNTIGRTSLRDQLVAQRYTVLADSLADGLAGFWTSTTANGGTATSSGGEGLVQTSANASGSAQITSTTVTYFPGQVSWFNSAVRFNDTGSAGNTRRIGVFTVSGTTPQDGAYFELSGTTLNAVVCLAGTPTATASGSWSRNSVAPFTLDTSYHSFELRFTANTVYFYVDNILRHVVSGTTAAITATLNFPITIHSINTSGATNRLIAVRNCGVGRFGDPAQSVDETGLSAVRSLAVGGGTPHDSVDSGHAVKIGAKAETSPAGITLVADGDRTNLYADADGLLITKPYTAYGDILVERVTNTDGNSTASTVFGATASARNCITSIALHNSSATNGFVDFRDGTGGTVLFTLPLPAGGGSVTNFPLPLRQTTANTALAYDVSAALTTVYISFIGFKSKA